MIDEKNLEKELEKELEKKLRETWMLDFKSREDTN